jgi:Tfp pilus assembly protein PilN
MLPTNELDAAIAEAKFASEKKLIDAREALSSLRSNLDRYTVKLLSRAYRDLDGIYDYMQMYF